MLFIPSNLLSTNIVAFLSESHTQPGHLKHSSANENRIMHWCISGAVWSVLSIANDRGPMIWHGSFGVRCWHVQSRHLGVFFLLISATANTDAISPRNTFNQFPPWKLWVTFTNGCVNSSLITTCQHAYSKQQSWRGSSWKMETHSLPLQTVHFRMCVFPFCMLKVCFESRR